MPSSHLFGASTTTLLSLVTCCSFEVQLDGKAELGTVFPPELKNKLFKLL